MNNQRHMALSNLFSSLSSLAANNQVKLGQQQVALVENTSHVPTSSSQLITSVQTAVAAALIQQQFAASTQQTTSQLQDKLSANQQLNYLSNEQSSNLFNTPIQLLHQAPSQPPQQQQQRINFCTICNKELCNKYFMKTHMLKMHGINLGTEPTGSDEDSSGGNGSEPDEEKSGEEPVESADHANDFSCSSKTNRKKSTSSRGDAPPKKRSVPKGGKHATPMMNGFAGNSMGGVVHKQNTHGITSDYQDSGQFIYPFTDAATSAICPQNIYQPNTATYFPPAHPLAMFPGSFQDGAATNLDLSSSINRIPPAKKQRLSNPNNSSILQSTPISTDHIEKRGGECASDSGLKQQFESIYRLLLSQQQRASTATLDNPPTLAPNGLQFDANQMQATSNTINSLMCYTQSPNPFVLAAMSPAMIVDNILRNQHIFKRNQPPTQTEPKKSNLIGCANPLLNP